MKTPFSFATVGLLIAFGPAVAHAAKVTSDLTPPVKRQATVETAERLAHHKAPEPVPADMVSPFNPPDFEKVDPAQVAANPGSPPGTGPRVPPPGGGPAAPPGAAAPAPVAGDRETLEKLATQIQPTGMFKVGRENLLVIGVLRLKVGTRLTAAYNGQDYELELVAIDNTTFTLRYRGEEITRPIRPVK